MHIVDKLLTIHMTFTSSQRTRRVHATGGTVLLQDRIGYFMRGTKYSLESGSPVHLSPSASHLFVVGCGRPVALINQPTSVHVKCGETPWSCKGQWQLKIHKVKMLVVNLLV